VYMEKFPDKTWKGAPIVFRHEPVLLDTAGGLKNIEDLIAGDEAILCYNGDTIASFPLSRLLDFHGRIKPDATLALRSSGPLLNVNITGTGEICDIRGVLGNPGIRSCLFTGIYAIETSILRYIAAGKIESIVSTLIGRIAASPGSVMGSIVDEGIWHDIGSVEEYENLKSRADALEGM